MVRCKAEGGLARGAYYIVREHARPTDNAADGRSWTGSSTKKRGSPLLGFPRGAPRGTALRRSSEDGGGGRAARRVREVEDVEVPGPVELIRHGLHVRGQRVRVAPQAGHQEALDVLLHHRGQPEVRRRGPVVISLRQS